MLKTIFAVVVSFIAGVLAILVFHQGALAGLHALGETSLTAWRTEPAWPLGWPEWIEWSLWGGLWGVLLRGLMHNARGAGYYVGSIILAGVIPSAVFLFVVMPLSGHAVAADGDMHRIAGVVGLQALWGLGVALFMRPFRASA